MTRKRLRGAYYQVDKTEVDLKSMATYCAFLTAFGLFLTWLFLGEPPYTAPVLVVAALVPMAFSTAICLIITSESEYYLHEALQPYGWHRIWIYTALLPAWPVLIGSWWLMQRTKRENAEKDAETRKKLVEFMKILQEADVAAKFPEDAKLAIIKCCEFQKEQSKDGLAIDEQKMREIADRIQEFTGVGQMIRTEEDGDSESLRFLIIAKCVQARKVYCLGVYSLEIWENRTIVLSTLLTCASANERRRYDRLDREILKNFEKHENELLRWLYLGKIDELVRQTVDIVNDPRIFTDYDLRDIEERYPVMPELGE